MWRLAVKSSKLFSHSKYIDNSHFLRMRENAKNYQYEKNVPMFENYILIFSASNGIDLQVITLCPVHCPPSTMAGRN